ncbi:hypothetical protein HMPREF0026_01293 [Acinetobacter junii SH205]|uniref:Uncharacterized protein n=1 Tax=Acinetobacter junii SH205 TaxID=575587 RepID=D0SJJ5_ACIJU|nr:hypothetical protein [Acinetobacter junii]EEY94017.1 hypothetical protein HMPREF0026_01293 [Acinetobacter junii SH205]
MPVKIKINWDNENAVSESVRIYRSDSVFTPASLPSLLTEIFGDVYEYEDLNVIEDQTYFYMLSAKLGEQEVFTDCFEVLATPEVVIVFSIPKITAYGSEVVELSKPYTGALYTVSFFNTDGTKLFVSGQSTSSPNGKIMFSMFNCLNFNVLSYATEIIELPVNGTGILNACFFDYGRKILIDVIKSPGYARCIFSLPEKFDVRNAVLLNEMPYTTFNTHTVSEDGSYIFTANFKSEINRYSVIGDISSTYSLGNKVDYSNMAAYINGTIYSFGISSDGLTALIISGITTRIYSMQLFNAFNFSAIKSSHYLDVPDYRVNACNRMLYDSFLLLNKNYTGQDQQVKKLKITTTNW